MANIQSERQSQSEKAAIGYFFLVHYDLIVKLCKRSACQIVSMCTQDSHHFSFPATMLLNHQKPIYNCFVMRITEKAGEFINKVFELSSETCTYQMLRKKGKEIFKHNMSED